MLGISDLKEHEKEFVLNEIISYVFNVENLNSEGVKTFDLSYDYKYYFVDFLKLGINLNKQDISWWEFESILESIFLDENSNMSKVLSYRLYKKPPKDYKTYEREEHRRRMDMKRKYSLPSPEVEKGFDSLWKYLEKKVGEDKRN